MPISSAPRPKTMSPGHPHPDQGADQRRLHHLDRAGVPEAVGDGGPALDDADRQQRQEQHHRQADVQAPEAPLQQPVVPGRRGGHAAQAEQHQADAEQAVDAEQRGVRVHRRRVQALDVVERDRRVDQEAEDAGPQHVPEGDGDEEQDRPAIGRDPGRRPGEAVVVVALEAEQHQRHHLQRRDDRAQRHHRRRRAGPVEVVQGADDAAGQEDDGREQHGDRRHLRPGPGPAS